MPSLFEMLLDTMPFAAARNGINLNLDRKDIANLDTAEAAEYFRFFEPTAPIEVELPEVDPVLIPESQPIWAWSHGGDDPASVRHVYCRVRDADYVGHRVANSIAWGIEDPVGAFRREIRVTAAAGAKLILPLTTEFVAQKWLVRQGSFVEDQTPLWRLPGIMDNGLVVVFAYDIEPGTGQVVPADITDALDPTLREKLRKAQEAAKEVMGQAQEERQRWRPPHEEAKEKAQDAISGGEWGLHVLDGNLWDRRVEAGHGGVSGSPPPDSVSGEIGDVCPVPTAPGTLLVILTFTFFKERANFEPGGLVGFARCYPHLLVRANLPLAKIEASLRMDRPPTLRTWEESGRDMKASCCKPPYDAWGSELRGLLVTDSNIFASPLPEAVPFWGDLFDYFLEDPHEDHGWMPFHVVRSDRPEMRTSEEPLIHRELLTKVVMEYVQKMPRQGEFDSIHMAPRLRLVGLKDVVDPMTNTFYSVFSPHEMKVDSIAMAPFCAHDCFHLHWRWSSFHHKKWTFGWGPTGPYEIPGAPMVPLNQDVWLWLRADAAVTYHVVVSGEQDPIREYDWTVLMHHGFGYAVSIEAKLALDIALLALPVLATRYQFHDHKRDEITMGNSTALMYWLLRYRILISGATPRALPRLTVRGPELKKAREL